MKSSAIWSIVVVLLAIAITTNKKYGFFIIQSGSMEPTLEIGDLILVKKQLFYKERDVITYKNKDGKIVTHRISKVTKNNDYLTKGDANETVDLGITNSNEVIGTINQIIPKIGFLGNFANSKTGFTVFFVLPVLILFIKQVLAASK